MKIYTQINDDEDVGALSGVDVSKRRWTESSADVAGGAVVVAATIAEDQVDLIKSRHAREDGGWIKEICLFPGVQVADIAVVSA